MTTATIDITGFEQVLQNATVRHNTYLGNVDADFKPLTPEAYLQELVLRQLEGLATTTERIKSDEEARADEAARVRARITGSISRLSKLG